MRALTLLLLLTGLSAAAPYPQFVDQPRLTLPITLYSEDPNHWTTEQLNEALTLADTYLDRCGMDLEWGPVLPLRPGDAAAPQRLWRTDRAEEIVLRMRVANDRRHYKLAGLANLRRVRGRWMGDAPWGDLALAVALEIGRGTLKLWPRPTGADAGESIAKARLALIWAAAKGWITLEPAVAEDHCTFLRKRFMKLSKKPPRAGQPQRTSPYHQRGRALRLPGPPTDLLIADVANRNAFSSAIRVGDSWHMRGTNTRASRPLAAHGAGRALLRVGGTSLLLSENAQGVHAAWWYPDPKRRKAFRPDRQLKDCSRVLAADVLRPPGDAEAGDPGTAIVVCPERIFQLTPLPKHPERSDALAPATWATLTRWGPGRTRLITGQAGGAKAWDLFMRAPAKAAPNQHLRALSRARPQAPIWHAPGADPVQLAGTALHGLPGGPRPLGADAQVAFNPNLYRAVRLQPADATHRAVRVDALYEALPRTAKIKKDALWATHLGDYGPLLWALEPDGKRWRLRAPAAGKMDRTRLRLPKKHRWPRKPIPAKAPNRSGR
jgi:hypothetical protein